MSLYLSHVAIACPQIEQAIGRMEALRLVVERTCEVPAEKVRAAFVPVAVSPHFRIEFIEPLDNSSVLAKFLAERPKGGLHHLCFEVSHLDGWMQGLVNAGLTILPPGIREGARGRALFIHPKDMVGVLVELEEIHELSA